MSEEQDRRAPRIKEVIERLGRSPDGKPSRVQVREAQRLARANNNLVCTMVGEWNEQHGFSKKGKAKPSGGRRAKSGSKAIRGARATPPPTQLRANIRQSSELAELRAKVLALETVIRGAVEQTMIEGGSPSADVTPAPAVATVDEMEFTVIASVRHPTNPSESEPSAGLDAATNETGPVLHALPAASARSAIATSASAKLVDPPGDGDPFELATAEVVGILKALVTVQAVAVFDLLPDDLRKAISRRRAQEILRAAAAREPRIRQLPDRNWYWSDSVIEIPRQRAKSDSYWAIRATFANFAVAVMELHNRPLAAVELYDLYARKKIDEPAFEPGFVRGYTSDVLSTCGDERLRKLPDGSWYLADREPPAVHSGRGYHSRVRNDAYVELGRLVVGLLQEVGYPMSGPEIAERIPPTLTARLPAHDVHQSLQMATRDVPELYRRDDKRWWLKGAAVAGNPPPSRLERLAAETIVILEQHGSLAAKAIRRHLSADLQKAFPSILKPLRNLRIRYPLIVVGANGICWLQRAGACSEAAESGGVDREL